MTKLLLLEQLEKALTVSQMFFGNSDFAALTSNSSHSMSRSRAISSFFVISDANICNKSEQSNRL